MRMYREASAVAAALLLGATANLYGAATVANVTMAQLAQTRKVEIKYDLSGGDAIVTLAIEVDGEALPESSLTWLEGDVCRKVSAGSGKTIVWNAGADWPGHTVEGARAIVTAWDPTDPPPVMVVDLSAGSGAASYPITYYPSLEALPGGGVTNFVYKSAQMVLRRISMATMPPYGVFSMSPADGAQLAVRLTQDYYIGIYEVTQGHWINVRGGSLTGTTDPTTAYFRPRASIPYSTIRGTESGTGWPADNAVDESSFMGRLRARTDLEGFVFDLPTEAQWEYACRANTQTHYNDGIWGLPSSTYLWGAGSSLTSNAQMDVLGRYQCNGGHVYDESDGNWKRPAADCGPEVGTAIVGSYQPNSWGLYDMHGNVFEWCLDWYGSPPEGGCDPLGPASNASDLRVYRDGGWTVDANYQHSTRRDSRVSTSGSNRGGLRVAAMIPLPAAPQQE